MIRTAQSPFSTAATRAAPRYQARWPAQHQKVRKVGASKGIRLPRAFSVRPITTQISLLESRCADVANLRPSDARARQHRRFFDLSWWGGLALAQMLGLFLPALSAFKWNIAKRSSNRSTLLQLCILRRLPVCSRSSRCSSSQCLRVRYSSRSG